MNNLNNMACTLNICLKIDVEIQWGVENLRVIFVLSLCRSQKVNATPMSYAANSDISSQPLLFAQEKQ